MNSASSSPNGLSARLPSLPEAVETWISTYAADEDHHAATLRRVGARGAWVRSKQLPKATEDPGELVLDAVSTHVTAHGRGQFQLVSEGYDSIEWTSEPPGGIELPDIEEEAGDVCPACGLSRSRVPNSVVRMCYNLMFECTEKMIAATSAAPRFLTELGSVMRARLQDAADSSAVMDNVIAKGQVADQKFGRVIEVLKMLGGDPAAALTGDKSKDKGVVQGLVTRLLGALSREERSNVLARNDLVDALYSAVDHPALEVALKSLWQLVSDGEVTLSSETKDKLRAIIKSANATT